ncbi:MAG: hypothetical protein DRP79_07745, partial [Planctomycetota bacterium]
DGRYTARLANGGMKVVCTRSDGTVLCEIPLVELAGRPISLGPWSPRADSFIIKQHAVMRFDETLPPKILIADVQTRTVRAIADGVQPAWSADGRYILYTSPAARVPFRDLDRGEINVLHTEIRLVPASGGQPVRLTSKPAICGTPTVFAETAREPVNDFARVGVSPPVVSATEGNIESHMAPQPPAPAESSAALSLIGEFTSHTGFTAFRPGPAGGGPKAVIVASEKSPPSAGNNCEITVYTLQNGRYVQTEKRVGKMSLEEEKYEKKFTPDKTRNLTPEEAQATVGGGLADNASVRLAREVDMLPVIGRERLIVYVVQQADRRWQTFLAVYRPEGEGAWKQEISIALHTDSGELPLVNAGLKDVDGDGRDELLISHTITLTGGWRENLKIFKIRSG